MNSDSRHFIIAWNRAQNSIHDLLLQQSHVLISTLLPIVLRASCVFVGIPNFSKQMSQVARSTNQQPLVVVVAVAVAAVEASKISEMPSSSSENRSADRPVLPRPLKKKAPDECLRDDEERESSYEIMKLLEKSATRPNPAIELELEENHKPELLAVSTAQRKRPRLAVELDSERKQSRSLELSLLEALLPPKSK